MDSLTFVPGRAFLSSDSPTVPWTVVFEDEGAAGHFYACDRSFTTLEQSILDAMLIYHVGTPLAANAEGTLHWVELARLTDVNLWEGDRHFLPLVFNGSDEQFHGVMPYRAGRPVSWQFSLVRT